MFTSTDSKNNKRKDGRHCDLCGCSSPAVRCDKCNSQIFCLSCDDMYHRHPKRRFHLRKAVDPAPVQLARPVLPAKVSNLPVAPGDPSKMPLPPPRKKKSSKSIFDTFRRGSPVSETNPNLPKKEYSWSDRFGSIKKFMSQRPLPPVPDDGSDTFPPETESSKGDFSFIHTKGSEEPPALPQRIQQKSPDNLQKNVNGTDTREFSTHENGYFHGDNVNHMHMQWTHDQQNDRKHSLPLPPHENAHDFGTVRRQSQPVQSTSPSASSDDNRYGGMQQSSSATDLHALSTMPPNARMPNYPYPFAAPIPPQYPGPYPMYPQYPPYPQYFGNSWANLSSPPQTTDGDFSDQSEASGVNFPHIRNAQYNDRKAKRSHSAVMDRVPYPNQYYPYGPYPPGGYPPPPWIQGHPKEAPPSPATSLRSLSRLSYKKKKDTDDDEEDDFSSSPLSRPKSSSSEISKMPRKSRRPSCPSSSSDEEMGKERHRPKASPALERRLHKQEMLRRKNASPKQQSNVQQSPTAGRRYSADQKRSNKIQSSKIPHSEIKGNVSEKSNEEMKQKNINKASSPEIERGPSKDKDDPHWTPSERWYCKHCTFLNEPNERICRVCCKSIVRSELLSSEPQLEIDQISPPPESRLSPNIKTATIPRTVSPKDKQEIALLSSALDEAEKEISRSLGELLKIKDETMEKNDKNEINDMNVQNSPIKDTKISSNIINSNSPETKEISMNNKTSSKQQSETQTSFVNNNISSTAVTSNEESNVYKDSFCQTYQDVVIPEFATEKTDQNKGYTASEMISNIQSPLPFDGYNKSERGTFGMQRAHSRASLFGGRYNDTTPEFGGVGFLPSLYRSLSRTSLLGDAADTWQSDYYTRNKPDFYLSMEELVERRRQETMRAQGLELVRMIREAEQQGFTADDIQVALNNCGKQNPVNWLQENWKTMIHTVVTLATNYGKDKKENDVGGISPNEARDALRLHKGNIWAAVTECVESRQRKVLQLSARGNFTFSAIIDALTSHEGNVELAFSELTKTSLKPFLMRIWGSGEGAQNLDAAFPDDFDYSKEVEKLKNESRFKDDYDKNGSDQDVWEDEDYDEENWEELEEENRDLNSAATNTEHKDDTDNQSQDYDFHTAVDIESKSNTLTSLLTPESDMSEYCDAFGSALSERYLSSTSIDEIYLLGVEEEVEEKVENDSQLDITKEKLEKSSKRTGFLKNLANMKKNENSKIEKSEKLENNDITNNEKGNEPKSTVEKTNNKDFGPLSALKKTFSALKDTVTNNTNKKGPSLSEKRTIIVHDKIPSESISNKENIKSMPSVAQQEETLTHSNNCLNTNKPIELVPEKSNHSQISIESDLDQKSKNAEVSRKFINENINGNAQHINKNIIFETNTSHKNSTAQFDADKITDSNLNENVSNIDINTFSSNNLKSNTHLENTAIEKDASNIIENEPVLRTFGEEINQNNINSQSNVELINKAESSLSNEPLKSENNNSEINIISNESIPIELKIKENKGHKNDENLNSEDSPMKSQCSINEDASSAKLNKTTPNENENFLISSSTSEQTSEISNQQLISEIPKTNEEVVNTEYKNIELKTLHNKDIQQSSTEHLLSENSQNDNLPSDKEKLQVEKYCLNDQKVHGNLSNENLEIQTSAMKEEISKTENVAMDKFQISEVFSNENIVTGNKILQNESNEESQAISTEKNDKTLEIIPKNNIETTEAILLNNANADNSNTTEADCVIISSKMGINSEENLNNINIPHEENAIDILSDDKPFLPGPSKVTEKQSDIIENKQLTEIEANEKGFKPKKTSTRSTNKTKKKSVEKKELEKTIKSNSETEKDLMQNNSVISAVSDQITINLNKTILDNKPDIQENLLKEKMEKNTEVQSLNLNSMPSSDKQHEENIVDIPRDNELKFDEQNKEEETKPSVESQSLLSSTSYETNTSEKLPNTKTTVDVVIPNSNFSTISSDEINEPDRKSDLNAENSITDSPENHELQIIKSAISEVIENAHVIVENNQTESVEQNTQPLTETKTHEQFVNIDPKTNSSVSEIPSAKIDKQISGNELSSDYLDDSSKHLEDSSRNELLSEDESNSEEIYAERNFGLIRPASHLRRMSFNTRKQAIFQERKIDKPWFFQKKIETYKPAFPKRTIKQQLEFERRVRKLVADRKCRTYRKAEIIVQLLDMKFDESEAIEAANECSTLEQAISFLQQECQLCAGNYPIREIISMVHCSHKACRECIKAYFTIQIRDRTIMELLCPFCNEPDISDEDVAQDYFNHLDIMLKKLVDEDIHELFQRKLRDRVLMKDPNFRWCVQCSSGFIADPYLKRLICPDCNAIMCASCRRLWEREHEGVPCDAFAAYKDSIDPDAQTVSLAKLLTENGIDCPCCHFKYALAKGGCMHFKCIQCQHDFCSGCSRPFKMGQKCGVSEFCAKLGLHAHHPRNCLFYLRDKDPEDLQKLLDMNGVKYDKEFSETEGKNLCQVMEQKETPQGMIDDICGKDVENGFAGLCRLHYVEYLGQLVNKNRIDPIQIFDNDDLELVLKRASIRLPSKKYRESDRDYREKLLEVIEDQLPLAKVEGS